MFDQIDELVNLANLLGGAGKSLHGQIELYQKEKLIASQTGILTNSKDIDDNQDQNLLDIQSIPVQQ